MYVKVIIEIGVKAVDKEYVYKVPTAFLDKIKVGVRVKVNFGTQLLEGFITEIINNYEGNILVRDILEVVDDTPILNEEMFELADYLVNKTLCSKISAFQVMLPKALKAKNKTNMHKKFNKYIVLNSDINQVNDYIASCKYNSQKEILNKLLNEKKVLITSLSSGIKTLEKKGLIKIIEEEVYRYNIIKDNDFKKVSLNSDQERVVEKLISNLNISKTFLLYGITGSGKTEVYLEVIDNVLKEGKNAIMLVPEISLTPQIVQRFVNRFGNNIAILHSGLSDSEKYDEYRKIKEGLVKIVIGARSAIFAPFDNIGAIIIDEEHTPTYKQDETSPRYDAKDVAIWRSKYHKCPLILGSATPSLESFARAGNHVFELLTLTRRPAGSILPEVHIVDMK